MRQFGLRQTVPTPCDPCTGLFVVEDPLVLIGRHDMQTALSYENIGGNM